MTSNVEPVISICVPTYNRVECLKAALDSILPQLVPGVELLVSDNASTDSTQQLMAGLVKSNPNIRYLRNESNLGPGKNIFDLIDHAKGRYVFFFCDDDVLLEGSVRHILSMINLHNEVSVFFLNFYGFKKDWKSKDFINFSAKDDILFTDHNKLLDFMSFRIAFLSSIIINKKDYLETPDVKGIAGDAFPQLHFLLNMFLLRKPCLWVSRLCVAQLTGVSPVNIVRVFGYEFQRILWLYQPKGFSWWTIYKFVNKNLLRLARNIFFSHCLGTNMRSKSDMGMLFKTYWSYPLFWLCMVPAIIFPISAAKPLYRLFAQLKKNSKGLRNI